MNTKELKESKDYELEICITDEYANYDCFDEWGGAYAWYENDKGVEYNFCVQKWGNCSAIYKMTKDNDDYFDTDGHTFNHYEIDFSNPNWKEELENAMCESLIEFFDL